jgi:hypothetical protein
MTLSVLAGKGAGMWFAEMKKTCAVLRRIPAPMLHAGGRRTVLPWIMICLVLVLTAAALGQSGDGEEGMQITRRGSDPIHQIADAWQRWKDVVLWACTGLLLVVALRILRPFRLYDVAGERLLKRAVGNVEELLKRIQQEAETAREDSDDETAAEGGLLGGLAEVAEFTQAEHVPAYVLTVNDVMLDNIRITLRRLRRFTEGNAPRYRDYLFSVLKGIKTLTEQSAEAGIPSGLAVDIREYFADERRCRAWRKALGRAARRGAHQETAEAFLVFMKDLKAGRPLAPAKPMANPTPPVVDSSAPPAGDIPEVLNEQTLPAVQQAAAREARALCAWARTGKPPDDLYAWQFEFVRRQESIHRREDARHLLTVFLNGERKSLYAITKVRMLPCRTWGHVLRLLGVESAGRLHQRIENRFLVLQEIVILEKAFLQTFAKGESLLRIYGQGEAGRLMMELHVPQIRRETLVVLRALHAADAERLNDATQALDEEETPQNHQVRRLIEHYIHHRHDPPDAEKKPADGSEASYR